MVRGASPVEGNDICDAVVSYRARYDEFGHRHLRRLHVLRPAAVCFRVLGRTKERCTSGRARVAARTRL